MGSMEVEYVEDDRSTTATSITEDAPNTVRLPVSKPHMLKNKWTLWYDVPSAKKTTQQNWAANLKTVCTIESVEDFWAMFQHIPKPTEVVLGSNYYLFRDGIKPMWEDPINSAGGKWTFSVNSPNSKIDHYWLLCMLGCISHACNNEHAFINERLRIPDFSHDICGVVLSIRPKQNRVSIWTREAANEQSCVRIGEFFKSWCELPHDCRGGYQPHSPGDARVSGQRDKYTV